MSESRYLIVWLCALLTLAGVYLVFVVAVDPYGMWGTPRISGFNAVKPAATNKVRLVKPYQLPRAESVTVVVGNSRPEAGLNPDSRCWPPEARPVFNFGIPGASVQQQLTNALTAAALPATRRLVITIDFSDFLQRRQSERADNAAEVPLRPQQSGWTDTLRDYAETTFSLDTLSDLVMTIAAQRNPLTANVTASGFNDGHMFEAVIRYEGQQVLFAQKNAELASRLQPGALHLTEDSPDFATLDQSLAQLAATDIDVILAINPYHVDYLTHIENGGYGSAFEHWKKSIVAIAKRHNRTVWDFSTRHHYATDRAPAPGLSDWFYEPAHYTDKLGDHMLAHMFGTCADLGTADDFGRRLTSAR